MFCLSRNINIVSDWSLFSIVIEDKRRMRRGYDRAVLS